MGKTYRTGSIKARSFLRKPKGYLNAVRNGARKKSVPPTSWDDNLINGENGVVGNAVRNMLSEGLHRERIIKKIMKKFKLSYSDAEYIVGLEEKHYNRSAMWR